MATYIPSSPAFHVTPRVLCDMAQMVSEPEKRIESAPECSICYEPMTIYNSYETQCGHTFHKNCLCRWRDQEKSTCPLCRHNIFVVEQDLESWLRMLNLSE